MANPNSWIVKEKNTKRQPLVTTGTNANLIQLTFTGSVDGDGLHWSYKEASEATGQEVTFQQGNAATDAHKEALIAKARKNAQERHCRLIIRRGPGAWGCKNEQEDYRK